MPTNKPVSCQFEAAWRKTLRLSSRDGAGSGAVGAFGLLLQAHPTLAAWIAECVRSKRIAVHQISTDVGLRTRLRGLKHLHSDFLRQCRTLGLTAADYPFNTDRMGIR